jgi:mannosyltransferase
MTTTPSAASRRPLLIGLALFAIVAGLHLSTLDLHSMSNDEFITLDSIDLDYPGIVDERLHSNHMPGYFLMLKAWTGLAGHSEAALHFPSALGALLGILLVWRLGAMLWGEKLALLVLALCGLNQVNLQMGHFARMYSLLFCCHALSLVALIRYLERGRRIDLVWQVVAGILGLAMHMLYLLSTVAAAIYLCWRGRRCRPDRRRAALWANLAPLLLLTPLVIAWVRLQHKLGGTGQWYKFELVDAFREMFVVFTGDYKSLNIKAVQILGILLVLGCFFVTARALRRGGASEGPHRYDDLLLIWCLTPTLATALASVRTESNLNAVRYFVMVSAAAPLLFASAALWVGGFGRRRLATTTAAVFTAAMTANTVAYLFAPGTGLREVARHIGADYRPGDCVVVSAARRRSRAFIYYGPLDAIPPYLPASLETGDEEVAWLRATAGVAPRLWAVFYKEPKKDRLYKVVTEATDAFAPQGEIFWHGETGVGLFRLIADAPAGETFDRSPAALP